MLAALALAAVALAVAGILIASAKPDGIQILSAAHSPAWLHAPLADYQVRGIQSPWIRRSAAGIAGLALIYAVCMFGGRWIRQRSA